MSLESNWHRIQINLLVDLIHQLWSTHDDYFAAGNMLVHFNSQQLLTRDCCGVDFFVVKGVDPRPARQSWKTWEENGRFPNVVIELLSPEMAEARPSTLPLTEVAGQALAAKKQLYERTFQTPEYFVYDPGTCWLYGWQLSEGSYRELQPDEQGWLWSEELQVWLGEWKGEYQHVQAAWLRFYTQQEELAPTGEEVQAAARRSETIARCEAEARAQAAEAQLARLRNALARLQKEIY